MGKVWVLDTGTKGTGAEMVPLEKVLRKPGPGAEPAVARPRPRPVEDGEPAQPRRFKVVDVMTHDVLAEDTGTRATVDVLEGRRSIFDVRIYVWDARSVVEGGQCGTRRVKERPAEHERDRAHGHRSNIRSRELPARVVRSGERVALPASRRRVGQQLVQERAGDATIGLAADGAELRTNAKPVEDAAAVGDVVERFRAKYGADRVAAYYPKLDAAVEVPLA